MTTLINASTSSGLVQTADTSGILQLQTASTAAVTIDASQNVGIGYTTPDAKLVVGGYTGGAYNTAFNYASQYNFLVQGTSGYTMFRKSDGTEMMRLDSSGNLGIGTTPSYKLDVSGQIRAATNILSNGYSISVQPTTNTVACYSSYINGGGTSYIGLDSSTASSFGTAGNYGSVWWRPANTDLGISCSSDVNLRIKAVGTLILQGGATNPGGVGITFPASQVASSDANTLDDYEEGSFTPTLIRTSGNPTVTYGTQQAIYTKIGSLVQVQIFLSWTANSGGSGQFGISGLPFTVVSGNYGWAQFFSADFTNISFPSASYTQLGCETQQGGASLLFLAVGSNVTASSSVTLGNTGSIYISGTYRAA